MNFIDKIYYSTLNSSTTSAKIFTGWILLLIALLAYLTGANDLFANIRVLGFIFLSLGSFLSAESIFKNWQIGGERFPVRVRKFLIIFFDFIGLAFLVVGFIYFFFLN